MHAQRATQLMGQLPEHREGRGYAFEYTSIDTFGPLYLRPTPKATKTREYYAQVFLCQKTRAAHIELCFDRTAQQFVDSFVRFSSIRGLPRYVVTDNAAELHRASREIKDVLHQANEAIKKLGEEKFRLDWSFVPPLCPQNNGGAEALVKSFK